MSQANLKHKMTMYRRKSATKTNTEEPGLAIHHTLWVSANFATIEVAALLNPLAVIVMVASILSLYTAFEWIGGASSNFFWK